MQKNKARSIERWLFGRLLSEWLLSSQICRMFPFYPVLMMFSGSWCGGKKLRAHFTMCEE